jgi:methionyl-tRNA formyltransferase
MTTKASQLPRVVFMGTPEFAVGTLAALLQAGVPVVGVVTAPDKPAGRGHKLQASAVKQFALAQNLPVLQPTNLKDPAFQEAMAALGGDLFVVVAFRMLPQAVWAMPPMGTLNLHASLLPKYRGAAPINWAIIRGEQETGVTTFFITHTIDTGDLLLQQSVPIAPDMNAGALHDVLMTVGAQLVVQTVAQLAAGTLHGTPQPVGEDLPTAPKIFPSDCQLNWHSPARAVYDKLRGLAPYPGAWSKLDGALVKLLAASPAIDYATPAVAPGTLQVRHKHQLWACAQDGWLQILSLKPEGKREMAADAFVNGYAPGGKQLQ